MFNKKTLYLAVILSCAMLCFGRTAAQDAPASPKPQAEKPAEEKAKGRPPIEQYHLEFSINELDDGKKINSRQYSMDLGTGGGGDEIKIGTRIPVATKEGESREFQYVDVGTSIFARIEENRDQTSLTVRAENSNLAPETNPGERRDLGPVIRQLKMGGTVLLPISKPAIISSADDPNSRRQFQLEVTVTKIR
jgi:hypothetical protein